MSTTQYGWRSGNVSRRTRPILAAMIFTGLAVAVVPGQAQQQDDELLIRRCESELEFQMGRAVGGRRPDVDVDYRRARLRQESGSRVGIRGTGIYHRDRDDRGRPYSFDCSVSTRNGSVDVTYRWEDSSWDKRPGGDPPPVVIAPADEKPFFTGALVNQNSGKCLDVEDRSLRDGARLQQWSCSGGGNQRWEVVDRGRGHYSIISQGSGKALEVADNSNQDGGLVQQNRYNGRDHQLWRLDRSGSNRYKVVSVSSGKCLDVFDASRNDGAKVQQWSCSGGYNQTWMLKP
ncbi:MAG TPA: RICIN domain-containing protein [Vicinamibacterales bacterium]|nr:RICIN domain-containing protein [Vicinamibacterales bacterium]